MRIFFFIATLALLIALPAAAIAETGYAQVPSDAERQAVSDLVRAAQIRWNPACDVPEFRDTHPDIRFVIGKDGRVVSGPEWTNQRPEAVWQTAAQRAKAAVVQGQPYVGLPETLYGHLIVITFDAQKACN